VPALIASNAPFKVVKVPEVVPLVAVNETCARVTKEKTTANSRKKSFLIKQNLNKLISPPIHERAIEDI
jgi:hypothetical protein